METLKRPAGAAGCLLHLDISGPVANLALGTIGSTDIRAGATAQRFRLGEGVARSSRRRWSTHLLKVLESERSGARDVERLRNEYDIGRALRGSPVLEPLGLGMFEGRPALELAAFEGRPLDEFVRAPMPVGDFLRVAVSLARAVGDIHARGVVHRDLKPGNVLFQPESGEVRIGGFGLAVRAASGHTPPPPSCIEGSFPYMSPEQTGQMNRMVDVRSDLYSVGVVLYQLLTAHLPFEAADALGWIHCHLARKPVPPDEVSPSVPGALSAIVLKLLAKMPDDRYQTAAGLAHDLARSQRQWRERGVITSFPLGQHDISDRFLVPHKLYGREREVAALRAALDRVRATGTPELVVVSGHAGIGKSAVVRESMEWTPRKGALLVAGKCEQHKSEIPYLAIARAFGELVLDIVAEGEHEFARWRERLARELGHGAQSVADVIPQIRLVLGELPCVTVSTSEAEARLRMAFQRLFGVFGEAERPLVVFLDDLQWADAASLRLLVDLLSDGSMRHVLLLGAYRDDEVGPSHRLAQSIARMREGGAVVRELPLGPLVEEDLSRMIADTLHVSREEVKPLADLVGEKTGANPFFTIQFLTTLHSSGAITFDRSASKWRWDAAQVRVGVTTDNVADLMVAKLRRLPADVQWVLQVAACMGATVERDTLAAVLERDPDAALRRALEEDLLLRLDDGYRFSHDRVQEAAYSLTEEGRRAELHLQIGRRLLSRTSPEALDEKAFEIAGQLDRGLALIRSQEERERVAELNLRAGRLAKASAAYASGARYLAAGMALLDESSWSTRHELTFRLGLERASCELLDGQFEVAERLIAELLPRCASKIDACDLYRVEIELHNRRSHPSEAVRTALACLRVLEIDLPAHPSRDEVQAGYEAVWRAVGDRSIESLVDLPLLGDPELQTALEVLSILKPAAFNFDGNLYRLLVCRMASLSIAHGVTDASADGFSNFGMLLGPHFHRYDDGLRFARLACALVEARGLRRYEAAVLVATSSAAAWTQPIAVAVDYARRAFDVAIETSELSQACYAAGVASMELTFSGEPLDSVRQEVERRLDFVRRVRFRDMVDWVTSQQRFVEDMQGRTANLSTFDGEHFDEAAFESQLTGTRNAILVAYYWALKLKAHFLAGDCMAALADAQRVAPVRWGMTGQIVLVDCAFFTALAAAACFEHAPPDEQPRLRELLAAQEQQLREWAEVCPFNFRDEHALVAAEIARIEGRELDAERSYENAVRSARDSGFVHREALAYEVAARFYRARGYGEIADLYLRKARDRYRRWGADGKVRQLERLHPLLAEGTSLGPATTVALQPEQLDLLSVLKASQTISSAMAKDELLRTLLRVVLEEGHARRACLVLFRQGESWPVPGDPDVLTECIAEEGPAATSRTSPDIAARVPVSIVQYVRRTHSRVVLDDATADAGRFSGDPYLVRARPRALVCVPVLRQAEAVAALVLENDSRSGGVHARASSGSRAARGAGGHLAREFSPAGAGTHRARRGGGIARARAPASRGDSPDVLDAGIRGGASRTGPSVLAVVRRLDRHRSRCRRQDRATGGSTPRSAEGAAPPGAGRQVPCPRPEPRHACPRGRRSGLSPVHFGRGNRARLQRSPPPRSCSHTGHTERHRRAARRPRAAARSPDARGRDTRPLPARGPGACEGDRAPRGTLDRQRTAARGDPTSPPSAGGFSRRGVSRASHARDVAPVVGSAAVALCEAGRSALAGDACAQPRACLGRDQSARAARR